MDDEQHCNLVSQEFNERRQSEIETWHGYLAEGMALTWGAQFAHVQ